MEFIAISLNMHSLLEEAAIIASDDGNILIEGETGTGKTNLARWIHQNSARAEKPCVQRGCGEINPGTAASTFFGHVRGAFTSAEKDQDGLFKIADGGTLILDDIDYLSRECQSILLRFLDDKQYNKLGSHNGPQDANIRLITTTNKNLQELVERKEFLPDLMYRIKNWHLQVPPLRNRQDDIEHFAKEYLQQIQLERNPNAKNLKCFNDCAIKELQDRSWPGNFRELYSEVKRLALFSGDKQVLEVQDVKQWMTHEEHHDHPVVQQRPALKKNELYTIIVKYNWNISQVSRETRLSRNTIYKQIEKHGWKKTGK